MSTDRTADVGRIDRMEIFREVLKRIENYIDANHLQPGDRLPSDRDLAASLGVSRPVVRQAIKVLEGLGRVSAHQGAGTFVRSDNHRVAAQELTRGLDFDRSLLVRLLPARRAIEVEVMRAAFSRRSPQMLAEIEARLKERDVYLAEDPQEASLDVGFEAALGRACGNEMLRRLQALIHEVWLQAQVAGGLQPKNRFRLHDEHHKIYDAFREGHLDSAIKLLTAHLVRLAGESC